jgi:hypothetical protein
LRFGPELALELAVAQRPSLAASSPAAAQKPCSDSPDALAPLRQRASALAEPALADPVVA